jgi:hypothetical protein
MKALIAKPEFADCQTEAAAAARAQADKLIAELDAGEIPVEPTRVPLNPKEVQVHPAIKPLVDGIRNATAEMAERAAKTAQAYARDDEPEEKPSEGWEIPTEEDPSTWKAFKENAAWRDDLYHGSWPQEGWVIFAEDKYNSRNGHVCAKADVGVKWSKKWSEAMIFKGHQDATMFLVQQDIKVSNFKLRVVSMYNPVLDFLEGDRSRLALEWVIVKTEYDQDRFTRRMLAKPHLSLGKEQILWTTDHEKARTFGAMADAEAYRKWNLSPDSDTCQYSVALADDPLLNRL